MQKSYLGTQILVYTAVVQIVSSPQLVNSPEVHHAATAILLTYELLLCLLLAFQIRGVPQPKPLDVPAATGLSVQPRLWTPTNATAVLILGGKRRGRLEISVSSNPSHRRGHRRASMHVSALQAEP
jgi:hypothetical protein